MAHRFVARRAARVALVGVAAIASACSTSLSGGPDAVQDPPAWLFAIQSEGEASFDAATSRLSMPARSVTAFTDRPHRDSSVISPESFAALWDVGGGDSFTADPPNAVLTYWDDAEAGAPRTVVCEVVGDVTSDDATGMISMGLEVLEPADAVLPATLHRSSLFVDDMTCSASPDDQRIVELFNMWSFDDSIEIIAGPAPTGGFELSLECPPRTEPYVPPSLELSLATADGAFTTTCDDRGLNLDPATFWATPACRDRPTCSFVVTLRNSETNAVFSATQLEYAVDIRQTFIPELETATVPTCGIPAGLLPTFRPVLDTDLPFTEPTFP
jgi:hypothetical protein